MRSVVFVDVDDTLVRSAGTKRIPMPRALARVRQLHREGTELYLWSSGGDPAVSGWRYRRHELPGEG